jgi:hypothetical protein
VAVLFSSRAHAFKVGDRSASFLEGVVEVYRVEGFLAYARKVRWYHDRAWRGVLAVVAVEALAAWAGLLLLG